MAGFNHHFRSNILNEKKNLIIFESNSDFWKFILIYADDVSTLNIIPNFLNTTTGVMHNNKWIAGFNYQFCILWKKMHFVIKGGLKITWKGLTILRKVVLTFISVFYETKKRRDIFDSNYRTFLWFEPMCQLRRILNRIYKTINCLLTMYM